MDKSLLRPRLAAEPFQIVTTGQGPQYMSDADTIGAGTIGRVLSITERFQADEAARRAALRTPREVPRVVTTPAFTPDALGDREREQIEALVNGASKHLRLIGHVNIVIAGQTGVGKSSLVNAVFGAQFAQVAAGRPVTRKAEWFTSPDMPLRLLDTKGLEAKNYYETLRKLRTEIEIARAKPTAGDQLHLAWVCIAAPSSRVQDAEIDLIRFLNSYQIPVVVVVTKYDDDDHAFVAAVGEILREHQADCASIVPVRAVPGARGTTAGLSDLTVATYASLPEAHRAAFAAAQKVNRELNREVAEECISAGVAAAAAAAVVPIPFADAIAIAPIQAGMLLGICNAFGLTLDRDQTMRLVKAALGALALSMAGRWAIGTTLKFIPGVGTGIGTVLNASVAVAITRKLGKDFVRFLCEFMEEHGRAPTAEEIVTGSPGFIRGR